jgi:hypothetical protein
MQNGRVTVQIWSVSGTGNVQLRTSAPGAFQSLLNLPFAPIITPPSHFLPLGPVGVVVKPTPLPIGGVVVHPTPLPIGTGLPGAATVTRLHLKAGSGTNGTLTAAQGTTPTSVVLPSPSGGHLPGTPRNLFVFTATDVNGKYDPKKHTLFNLLVDSGRLAGNSVEVRISYDFNGDGRFDRVETYRLFTTDNRPGWQAYTQEAGVSSVEGRFADMHHGRIKVEIWNVSGPGHVMLGLGGATDSLDSWLEAPFTGLTTGS